MKKQLFKVPIYGGEDKEPEIHEISAFVYSENFENNIIKLALHRPTRWSFDDLAILVENKDRDAGWVVSDFGSGYRIVEGLTKDGARQNVIEQIKITGISKYFEIRDKLKVINF